MSNFLLPFLGCLLGCFVWDVVKLAIRGYKLGGRDDA